MHARALRHSQYAPEVVRVFHSVQQEHERRFALFFGFGENIRKLAVVKVGYFRQKALMPSLSALAVESFLFAEKYLYSSALGVFYYFVCRGVFKTLLHKQSVYGFARLDCLAHGVASFYFHFFNSLIETFGFYRALLLVSFFIFEFTRHCEGARARGNPMHGTCKVTAPFARLRLPRRATPSSQ